MSDWFSNLDLLSKIYWLIAIIGSLIFTLVFILAFVGGDADEFDSVDSEIDGDAGIGFQFITFKNLVGFFTIFGWSGIACIEAGLSKPITFIISTFCGLVMMAIMASMFYLMRKLSDSGTLNYKNAIGAIGEVYLTIAANRAKMGKVTVTIQGASRELEALTDSLMELKSGTIIKVLDVTNNGILIVDQTRKPIEPIKQHTYEITDNSGKL
ncbi:hypothetical protein SAMN05428642_101598 [Flaviramulus basaltis]|uniref:NfeD-like C-terminal, partner-binding n=1 Tax=Flaviramulus basaltis TaxID=369401 RepID=A0A1K2IBP8_9FLAO|nr:hypothetical protein [Flaviramulus basaltis]SFZ89852.1 hypothetical protein SAMN05428642_101598 [Flaviramulus basaltis]